MTYRTGCSTFSRSMASDAPMEMRIDPAETFGEAEQSTFEGFKEPTLLYGYVCALRPEQRAARVQIHTRTLRDERELWAKDQSDRAMGKIPRVSARQRCFRKQAAWRCQ